MEKAPLVRWLRSELTQILECDVGDDYCHEMLLMDSKDIAAYFENLIDLSKHRNRQFLDEFLFRIQSPSDTGTDNIKIYRKQQIDDTTKSKQTQKQQKSKEVTPKKKVYDLYTLQTDPMSSIIVPGRLQCECQATKHGLVSNCLNCGRIVCEQEGSGPCLFCGNLVCTREEQEKINRGSRAGEKLKQELLNKGKDLEKAIEHKNKLINFDRNSAKRTQVIDDESDYFNSGSKWLSKRQQANLREKEQELYEKRFGSRLKQKVTFDFAGRSVLSEKEEPNFEKSYSEAEKILREKVDEPQWDTVNHNINWEAPKYIEVYGKPAKEDASRDKENKKSTRTLKIQDRELQELSDGGLCLSMHQPWASLLISGIKKHEGRSWYSPHRGRLWIHSGSAQKTQEEIEEVEEFYRNYYNDPNLEFPQAYPTSCLLGFVDLVDVLSKEEYKQKYPNGESESEYVFICENPSELVAKYPMKGQHKIFKLDTNIHKTVKRQQFYSALKN